MEKGMESAPRDAAAVRIFPPAVPVLTILAGTGLQRIWPIDAAAVLPAPARHWVGGLLAGAAILGLGAWAVSLMRKSGQSENPWKPTTRILDYGPYRFTRNPMYLQMVIVCIGFAILLANPWILLLVPLCVWALQQFVIRPEEAYLERKFGAEYLAYRARVRRWL